MQKLIHILFIYLFPMKQKNESIHENSSIRSKIMRDFFLSYLKIIISPHLPGV